MRNVELNAAVRAEIEKVIEVSAYLWQREWAERNGGNISVDLTDIFGEVPFNLDQFPHCPLSMVGGSSAFPADSAGHIFFVKGTGERIRELRDPTLAGCVLRIDDKAQGYHLLWGGRGQSDYKPTSEFISHVEIIMDKQRAGRPDRCVVHTHPLELIALSHHPKYAHDSKAYTQACWQMLPEVRAFVPRGIGIVPYCMPGSQVMADGTTTQLRHHDVAIWEKHGAVATGIDALQAFDFVDVANKGAKLHLMCLASGFEPEGVSMNDMRELEETFGL
ncbi:TPA: rhamnulose-1-phosphate aldolase [Enterobacter soli]|jgi:rhamnulose-1-phosphate aldolase|uniref:Rhamnulose-1-phosphate aldolase n=1 Tax=Enterobacter soli TaxID=885040 RepID=A0AAW8HBL5_9ENTR|nr:MULTISPECIES: rhamnulose-1-phosphate aldolase [Enterobacter]MDR2265049.1 rhamnulose-1-phosphate aldolase [Enterobacter asburiae]AEN66061.1 class II aldolase/adducin family protein [Enterobacter soli]MCR1316904.1 rhamnulose-1-phosphate aldolase [Enterobacter soli]MDD9245951.1 rhamnulose-1-phosphate aldolase [Enterobacter soli]MDQ2257302.1 rhamnulose-1-phosphate aldolase [Enterobacter soli]